MSLSILGILRKDLRDVNKNNARNFENLLPEHFFLNLMASNNVSQFNESNHRSYFFVVKVLASKNNET